MTTPGTPEEAAEVQAHIASALEAMEAKETDDVLEADVEAHGALWSISYRTASD